MEQEKHYDLFDSIGEQSEELKAIFERYEDDIADGLSYQQIAFILKEVEAIGYTFDYYLDAVPYGLRPIGIELKDLEEFKDLV